MTGSLMEAFDHWAREMELDAYVKHQRYLNHNLSQCGMTADELVIYNARVQGVNDRLDAVLARRKRRG